MASVRRVGVIVLVALGCRPQPPPATPRAAPSPPVSARVLVTIVVDQLAAWIADERLPLLPADGGFARLRREGTWYKEMRYAHAATDTALGHAALYTGRPPRTNGITSNEVIPSEGGKPRSILEDAATHLVGVTVGATDRPGSSLRVLRGDTLADAFVAREPRALVISLSLKDRGALFAAGRKPAVALWLDHELGEMVTSDAYPPPPAWAGAVGGRAAIARLISAPWELTGAEKAFVAAHAETPDDQPGEGDYAGLGITFPHRIPSARAMRATPAGDHLLLALAREAVRALAGEPRPLLLAISLSSHDYVAHAFGPHSWEEWSELLRLDRELASFFAFLDGVYGSGGWSALLSADHGSTALPEPSDKPNDPWCARPEAELKRWERVCGPRRRLQQPELTAALETALKKTFGGDGRWINGIADPLVFFGPRAQALGPADRTRAVGVAKEVLRGFGIIDVVDTRVAAATPCSPTGETMADLVCRSIAPGQAGDLYMVVDQGVFFDPTYAPGHGESHGSPYLYDRAVPLFVRAAGIGAGRIEDAPIAFTMMRAVAEAHLPAAR